MGQVKPDAEAAFRTTFAAGMGLFNGWFSTPWYAMLYRHRDQDDAAAMALPVIAKGSLKPGMSILDMGCGRGRHAAVFDREGLSVTGIDLSAESINEAATTTPTAHFEVFDIREPYAIGRFDAVVCLFTCLGYSDSRDDDARAISAAAIALKPKGLFVLDLLNGQVVAKELVPSESAVVDGARFCILRTKEGSDIVKRITVKHAHGVEEFEERVHAWSVSEVVEMVNQAGFLVESITDGSCFASFDPLHSGRMVIWARKTI